ncbi:conserved hypothetical protein [Nostocoides japonicum T1-X7]|uniref:Carboxypeptidase regulatory-like domain-containing protein n=1 Tax=Nostocoides japonicum T1-X7 TaxID=1194083 RepID=A0A077LW03_9MICO|nr:hypothetical protein [Tetrasphaera japonica]CCH78128.1 conserved hypothetical protein [Tetrasphaera japonica T1-X7]
MPEDWDDDDILFGVLREAITAPPAVPEEILEAGYAAFSWKDIDGELAALTYDSSLEDLALSGTRSERAGLRAMTFATASTTVELEVVDGVLLGQVVPAGATSVEVQTQDGPPRRVAVDALGCFTVEPVPTGRFRLLVEGDETTTTGWVTL